MTTITREQLIGRAQARLELMQAAAREFPDSYSVQMDLELASIALASLEAEPVAYMYKDGDDIEYNGHNEFSGGGKGVPLYAATPVPELMKDHQIRELVNDLRDIAIGYHGTQQLRERIARTVRAAMLQAGNFRETTE